jgi:hypothetical protein
VRRGHVLGGWKLFVYKLSSGEVLVSIWCNIDRYMLNVWSGYLLGGWKRFMYIVWSGYVFIGTWCDFEHDVYSLCRGYVLDSSWRNIDRDMHQLSI